MKKKSWINLILGSALGLGALAGCRGLSTPDERAARHEFSTVTKAYRPDGARPVLPELSASSSFSNYLRYAMLNQPKVAAAYFDWAASIERITVERSLPDPKLTFESDIADMVMTVMPGFMQEFPGPGKLKAASRVASAESRVKYFAFESAVLQTAFDLKRAHYNLHLLEEKLRINRQTLGLLENLEQIARAQNEVGKVTLQDVYRAQIERNQLTNEIANLSDSRRPLMAQFKAALGLGYGEPDPAIPAPPEPTKLDLDGDGILTAGLTRNPRLKAMEAEMRTAEAGIAMAAKSKIPDFSVGLMTDLKASPVMFRPLGEVTLPIWRDKIAAQIAAAHAARNAAAARLGSEQIMLAVDFAMKTYDYRETSRNLALLREQLIPKSRHSLELARAGYLAGNIDFFNLIDAQRTLLNFELAQVEAETRREILLTELSLMVAGVPPEGAPVLSSDIHPNSNASAR